MYTDKLPVFIILKCYFLIPFIFLILNADTQLREEKRKDEDIDVCSDYPVDHDAKRIRLESEENTCSRIM